MLKGGDILVGGKYFARKAFANRSHVVIEAGGCEFNHALALSFNVNGKSLKRIASSYTPLYLKVSQISKKLAI